jgi:integrase
MAKKAKQPEFKHCKVSKTSNPRAPWRVFFTVEREGKPKRVFKSFSNEGKALDFAKAKELEASNHGIRYGDIPPEVRRAFDYFRDEAAALGEIGAEVPRFEDLVKTVLDEIRTRHAQKAIAEIHVAEGVERFLDYKKTRVGTLMHSGLADRLKRFAEDFGDRPLSSITADQIDAWLGTLRSRRNPGKLPQVPLLSVLTRNHYRAAIGALFAHGAAPSRAWCPRNPLSDVKPETVAKGRPQAYSPDDAALIMQAALDHKPALVPVLALGMFAGLRTSEAVGFDLATLDFKRDEFRLPYGHKTGSRFAPFLPSCKAWMLAQPRRQGPAWITPPPKQPTDKVPPEYGLHEEMRGLFALAGVRRIVNGARHSFVSYRCAETKNTARVAKECGNSPTMVQDHYEEIVPAAAAKKYFAIRPAAKGAGKSKITHIETGRKTA